jgi:hypothetical protein
VDLMTAVDLSYDPTEVGSDLVVGCLVSQSPRAGDPGFDPRPGDIVSATDVDGEALQARVVRRDADLIWIRLDVSGLLQSPPRRADAGSA